ncbi:hypothetical protein N0V88_001170 [Collariella sp. IMI 366227]|nr:hypothetical protein N0V88_001170 [Collariella sp. IMI 366227]
MHFVGPKPFLVGLTCKEARQVMEKIYIPLTRSRAGSVTTTHWIDPDMTVVHFGDCDAGIAVLCDLLADGASKLKHVAVRWYFGYLPQIIRFSRQLEDRCPGLHTLVIRQAFKPTPADDTAQRPLPVESASVLALAPTDDKENFGILPASEFRCMTRLA